MQESISHMVRETEVTQSRKQHEEINQVSSFETGRRRSTLTGAGSPS